MFNEIYQRLKYEKIMKTIPIHKTHIVLCMGIVPI